MSASFVVEGREIGGEAPCFVIAEAGINHNGSLDLALRLVDEAKRAGADAVKFQKRTVERILTRAALDAPYVGAFSYGATYGEHRRALELSDEAWSKLLEHSRAVGILCFASPWDEESADFLHAAGVPLYKLASADLTNVGLLRHVAAKGRPVILSTGMSTIEEIDDAVATVSALTSEVAILHCVSAYPFDPPLANLRMIDTLRARYPHAVVGYSGHEKSGRVISVGAVARGAKILERHFTLDRHMRGSDHVASLEPHGFAELVENVRKLEAALGDGVKRLYAEERPVRAKLVKSVTAARAIRRGEVLTRDMLVMKGPGTGLPGGALERLVGRVAAVDLRADDHLPLDALDWPERA